MRHYYSVVVLKNAKSLLATEDDTVVIENISNVDTALGKIDLLSDIFGG
ncbi:hypothetical protein [Sodalis endosymbiont of Henestaris halophilus]|nr:hypothetical protein [Sodalis endosymbiont of Henestaris halophilus]